MQRLALHGGSPVLPSLEIGAYPLGYALQNLSPMSVLIKLPSDMKLALVISAIQSKVLPMSFSRGFSGSFASSFESGDVEGMVR